MADSAQGFPSEPQIRQVERTEISFSGPIPPPGLLAKYNEIIPNGADRILKMAEDQLQHRHHLEKKVVGQNTIQAWVGLCCAFVLAAGTIIGGFYLVFQGKDVTGITAIVAAITALAGVFIVGRRAARAERENRVAKMFRAIFGQQ